MTTQTQPKFGFSLSCYWQALKDREPIAPPRMFQWAAVNDLPPEACVRMSGDRYCYDDAFCVAWRPSDIHIHGSNWPPE